MIMSEEVRDQGFVSVGFHVGPTATAHVINTEEGNEPLLSISEESQWITLSSGLGNAGSAAHLHFARSLHAAAGRYLELLEKFAKRGETDGPAA